MSGPVLRMLGGKYNIEPFFFSSSLNWIPSRFQEDPRDGIGDHITITLPFMQVISGELVPRRHEDRKISETSFSDHIITDIIDTQAPLRIRPKRFETFNANGEPSRESALALDLLSVHLIRNVNGNTIISYHANMDLPTTKADYLHERIRFAGTVIVAMLIFPRFIFLCRPKCLLGKDAGESGRSHFLTAHLYLASGIRLG